MTITYSDTFNTRWLTTVRRAGRIHLSQINPPPSPPSTSLILTLSVNGPLVRRAVDKDLIFAERFANLRHTGVKQKLGSESATPQQQADTVFDIKVGGDERLCVSGADSGSAVVGRPVGVRACACGCMRVHAGACVCVRVRACACACVTCVRVCERERVGVSVCVCVREHMRARA